MARLWQHKALFKSPLTLLPGARSDNPIYAFFLVDDKMTIHPVSGVKSVAQKSYINNNNNNLFEFLKRINAFIMKFIDI